mmetsp:Transcript_122020/g.345843  ORF Transcript_122020/g.345843 Transcript_122020/m.345843 type:complete len:209 (+) Transcript_122020:681-1307(+)
MLQKNVRFTKQRPAAHHTSTQRSAIITGIEIVWMIRMALIIWQYGKGKGSSLIVCALARFTMPLDRSWKALLSIGAGIFTFSASMASTTARWIHWRTTTTSEPFGTSDKNSRKRVSTPCRSMIGNSTTWDVDNWRSAAPCSKLMKRTKMCWNRSAAWLRAASLVVNARRLLKALIHSPRIPCKSCPPCHQREYACCVRNTRTNESAVL